MHQYSLRIFCGIAVLRAIQAQEVSKMDLQMATTQFTTSLKVKVAKVSVSFEDFSRCSKSQVASPLPRHCQGGQT